MHDQDLLRLDCIQLGNGFVGNDMGFPGGSVVKNPPANPGDAKDADSFAGLGRSSGEVNGNPLQYSCLENPHGQKTLAGYNPWGRKESDRHD